MVSQVSAHDVISMIVCVAALAFAFMVWYGRSQSSMKRVHLLEHSPEATSNQQPSLALRHVATHHVSSRFDPFGRLFAANAAYSWGHVRALEEPAVRV